MFKLLASLSVLAATFSVHAGEVLYNGIELPERWPPKVQKLTMEPLATPAYLVSPPAVIPIDVGRQLFVDDFLVQSSTLQRVHHVAEYHPTNPVFQPDKAWEGGGASASSAVYSDGVWYDPDDRLFKLWYIAPGALPRSTWYATSRDGLRWEKPSLEVTPGTNAVVVDEKGLFRDSNTVWLDLDEKDPSRRFKMFRVVVAETEVGGRKQLRKWIKIHFSPDGIH